MNLFTELREGLQISWAAIRANKLRSVLTTLGIIIGVVTVTLMGTAIDGLNRAFIKSISFIGADVLYVHRFNWFNHSYEEWMKAQKRKEITLAQANSLEKQLTLARGVAPVADFQAPVKYKKGSSGGVEIIGTTEEYRAPGEVSVAQGRFLSPGEAQGARPFCVIGYDVATTLFQRDPPLGNKV